MAATSIAWCDHSINPIRARSKITGGVGHYCEKVAAGCANCYASNFQRRVHMPPFGAGQHRKDVEIFLDENKLDEVRRRKKPTRYFWCDMTDIFGDWMHGEWLAECFAAMDETPQHTHLLLTKRAHNVRRMWPQVTCKFCEDASCGLHRAGVIDKFHRGNVWLGTSIARVKDLANIDILRGCGDLSPVLFLSIEPLIEDLGKLDLTGIGWVIIGGESGHAASPCCVEWIAGIVEQCQAAGVPVFVKQLGAASFTEKFPTPENMRFQGIEGEFAGETFWPRLTDSKGSDPAEWPPFLRIQQFPKSESST